MTAHDALFTQAGLAIGERVCIHGAAGGVGTAAVHLASAAGATVIATVRDPDRRSAVEALGAQAAVDPEGFATHGPFDVILELIGAPNMASNLDALAVCGRISVLGFGAGSRAELNLMTLMMKRARIMGSTLRARPLEGKAMAARAVEAHVLPLFEGGVAPIPIVATYPLDEVASAYERFAAGGKLGKVVLTL
jgi:NADPH:quinone reductase-like Zn-dependent oxidoreductase